MERIYINIIKNKSILGILGMLVAFWCYTHYDKINTKELRRLFNYGYM